MSKTGESRKVQQEQLFKKPFLLRNALFDAENCLFLNDLANLLQDKYNAQKKTPGGLFKKV